MILVAGVHVACLEHVALGPLRCFNGLGCWVLWQTARSVLLASFSMFSLRLLVLEGQHKGHLAGPPFLLSEFQVFISVMV